MAGEIKLVITLSPDGKLNVGGPLANKLLCYGMLEQARDVVRQFEEPPMVQPASNIPIGNLSLFKGRKGGN